MRKDLRTIDGRTYDVVVIGGGISGASSAQHLAAAGYSVLLVEKDDFASAATSRSGRLLHCGLRYLAPTYSLLEFARDPKRFLASLGSAYRSIVASTEFRRTTPELARPMTLVFAITRTMPYRGWHVKAGARLLEWANRGKQKLKVEIHSADQAASKVPFVGWLRDREAIESVVTFEDHHFNWPERVCIDAVLDADRLGATVLNYTEATGLRQQPNRSWDVDLKDGVSGVAASVNGRVLLNMAGPWIDRVNQTVADGRPVPRKVIGVKGTHFLVRLPEQCRGHGIMGTNREGEAITCMPWGDLHYVGPTETPYEGSLDDVRPTEEEVGFLLDEVNHFMPGIGLSRGDVLQAWAGVRPITYDPAFPKGRRIPFSVFQDLGRDGLPNVLTTTWAAIMFHRSAAREVVEAVRKRLAPSGPPKPASFAARRFPDNQNSPPLLPHYPEVTIADIVHSAKREQPRHLVDILFRRTSAGWNAAIPPEAVRRAAEAVAPVLGWDDDAIEREIDAFVAYQARYHMQAGEGDWRS
ncbi:FAD-dependent oxidoreductase [Mesorhizobium sp. ZMM04-5]|uniref:FAD-dependent oxidoreductase n=1 Tax=Mesorhizobium marinum TaxID=3228790 RepID=A0ABV3R160_9HYPH